MRMALIQGMENANKTRARFGWCANGGFLEGSGGDLEVEDEIPAALFKHLPEASGCVARC
jgi:hypothetical protein